MPWWFSIATVVVFLLDVAVLKTIYGRMDRHERGTELQGQISLLRHIQGINITVLIMVLWFVPMSLILIGRSSDDAKNAAEGAEVAALEADRATVLTCNDSREFRATLVSFNDAAIARIRDEIEDKRRLLHSLPDSIRELNGYARMPESVREFLDEYINTQIVGLVAEIGDLNAQVIELSDEGDALTEASRRPCP